MSSGTEGQKKIKNPENLKKGSFIRIVRKDRDGQAIYGYLEILDTDIEGMMPLPDQIAEKSSFGAKERCIRFHDWASDGNEGAMVPA